ncbi:unnamed protein product [Meloidogyne enterolobii]|uniref:Uncharacterized protein n=1 Tax=Meloidogyne enterolobii TaxID=390850 RepID=A0ACB0ZEH9_MELEN
MKLFSFRKSLFYIKLYFRKAYSYTISLLKIPNIPTKMKNTSSPIITKSSPPPDCQNIFRLLSSTNNDINSVEDNKIKFHPLNGGKLNHKPSKGKLKPLFFV